MGNIHSVDINGCIPDNHKELNFFNTFQVTRVYGSTFKHLSILGETSSFQPVTGFFGLNFCKKIRKNGNADFDSQQAKRNTTKQAICMHTGSHNEHNGAYSIIICMFTQVQVISSTKSSNLILSISKKSCPSMIFSHTCTKTITLHTDTSLTSTQQLYLARSCICCQWH